MFQREDLVINYKNILDARSIGKDELPHGGDNSGPVDELPKETLIMSVIARKTNRPKGDSFDEAIRW